MTFLSLQSVTAFAEILTRALIHFVWQGAALTLILLVVVRTLDVRTARLRYLLSVFTLLMMGMAPLLTMAMFPSVNVAIQQSATVFDHSAPVVKDHRMAGAVADVEANDGRMTNPMHEVSDFGRIYRIDACILVAWLAGVLVLSLRLTIGFGITVWVRAKINPLSEEFEQRLRILGMRLGLNTRKRVFTSMRVGQAVAVGFIRPIVLVPMAWLTQLTPEMLEAVIAHELAHIRRLDLWVNLAQRIIETLLFYHPAVWWLSNRIRLEREMCCDEIAAECFDRAAYARFLESVARIAHSDLLLAASIDGGSKMNLLARIRYLLGVAPAEAGANWWAVGFVFFILPFLATMILSMIAGSAQSVAMAVDNSRSVASQDASVPKENMDVEQLTAWGKEVGGLQVGLGFIPGEKRDYRIGEFVTVVVRVRNPGKDDMNLEYVRDTFNYPPAIFDGEGNQYPKLKVYTDMDNIPMQVSLKAGEEIDLDELKLELRPANESGDKQMMKIYGTGKFHIQENYALIGKSWIGTAYSGAEWQAMISGKLELNVKETK